MSADRTRVRAGDLTIVTLPSAATRSELKEMHDAWKVGVPDRFPVVFIAGGGAQVQVVRGRPRTVRSGHTPRWAR